MTRMEMRRIGKFISVITLMLAAWAPKPAAAATIDIYRNGYGGDFAPLQTFFTGFGYTVNQLPSSFTTLAGADFVDLSLPDFTLSAAQLTAIDTYVNGGGRLLLNSEYNTFSPNGITEDNAILASLGSTMSVLSTSSVTGYHDTSDIVPNAFTAGVSDINYGDTSSISLGSGTALAYGDPATDNGQLFVAYQMIGAGYVFLITDSDTADNINLTTSNNNGILYCDFAGLGCGATSTPPAPVPEPASLTLLGSGLFGLAGLARRRLRKNS